MTKSVVALLVALLLAGCAGVQRGERVVGREGGEVVLFRKGLVDGRLLVVVRGRERAVEEFAEFLKPPGSEAVAVFPLRLELRGAGVAPLEIGSRLVAEVEIPGNDRGGFEILDVEVGNGQVVMATAENGDLFVWRFTSWGVVEADFLRRWSLAAAMLPIDTGSVSVQLGWTHDGLVKVEVTDERFKPELIRRTEFVQDGERWKFELKSHEEKKGGA